MVTTAAGLKQVTLQDFKGKVDPDWCPGCGDFGVLAALQKALVELGIQPHTCGDDQRYRLLLELTRICRDLRHAHTAWPRFGCRDRGQACQP